MRRSMVGPAPGHRAIAPWGWLLILAPVILGGCGGGSSGGTSGDDNKRPSLAGNAATDAAVDETYSFIPSASDADGDTLTFAIANKPAWAEFDTSNGRLSGTPTEADVGSYPNITISVSDGLARATIAAFTITVTATGNGTATISWIPPTENTDGTVLTDLAGYRIHYGKAASNLNRVVVIDTPGLTSYMIEGLTPATWYFAVTSVTADGAESSLSNLASKTIR